jgi:hypothetical protein
MAYFTGQLLERKVQEYSLAELDTKLAAIATGTDDTWPTGGFLIPASADIIESCRIVLYSILHSHGLKQAFIIRARYATNILSVDKRNSPGKSRRADVMYTDAPALGTSTNHSRPGPPPAVPEDLRSIFDDSLELDSVGSVGPGMAPLAQAEKDS